MIRDIYLKSGWLRGSKTRFVLGLFECLFFCHYVSTGNAVDISPAHDCATLFQRSESDGCDGNMFIVHMEAVC